ncbi:MAG TPA: 2-amino-4-hydroxy-6-hydroxymethyldihydropteridine diphosphokinase [Nevskiales bacterium]|nr:2-amino-4-hydroxy-6-hydroxymethyldihydropteridine diphosphokinase [Nevskiales bacterium]
MPPAEAARAAVALGSNLDQPAIHVRRALDELGQLPRTRLLVRSPLYRSVAVGPDGRPAPQPDFCNAVALLKTGLSPRELLQALQALEAAHGRRRGARWAPRSLDLDLLVHGDTVLDEPGLKLPHPRLAERNFVLYPLRDIAPELEIPGLGRVRELTQRLNDTGLESWRD